MRRRPAVSRGQAVGRVRNQQTEYCGAGGDAGNASANTYGLDRAVRPWIEHGCNEQGAGGEQQERGAMGKHGGIGIRRQDVGRVLGAEGEDRPEQVGRRVARRIHLQSEQGARGHHDQQPVAQRDGEQHDHRAPQNQHRQGVEEEETDQ